MLFAHIACFQEVEPSISEADLTKSQQPCDPQEWEFMWRGWVFSVRAALSTARVKEEMGMQQQQRSCMNPISSPAHETHHKDVEWFSLHRACSKA